MLLHKSYRNPIQMGLLIRYSATRTNNKWQGEAVIPIDYLPSNVSKINAYAFHGTGDNRVAEALHPVAKDSIPHADE